jgi:hypothetical protein
MGAYSNAMQEIFEQHLREFVDDALSQGVLWVPDALAGSARRGDQEHCGTRAGPREILCARVHRRAGGGSGLAQTRQAGALKDGLSTDRGRCWMTDSAAIKCISGNSI